MFIAESEIRSNIGDVVRSHGLLGAVNRYRSSASVILSTWMYRRDECNPNYIRFLDHHGGRTKEQMMVSA